MSKLMVSEIRCLTYIHIRTHTSIVIVYRSFIPLHCQLMCFIPQRASCAGSRECSVSENLTAGREWVTGRELKAGREPTAGRELKAGREPTAGRELKAGRELTAGREPTAGREWVTGRELKAGRELTAGRDIPAASCWTEETCVPRHSTSKVWHQAGGMCDKEFMFLEKSLFDVPYSTYQTYSRDQKNVFSLVPLHFFYHLLPFRSASVFVRL